MGKSKFLRCTQEGCRTLTAQGLCDRHRAPEPKARPPGWKTDEEWAEIMAEVEGRVKAQEPIRKHRAALRADLAALWDGAERAFRAAERPTFAEE